MPMVEVDEVQLQQSHKLKQTVENWLKNPKAKRKILEAQKLVDPKADIPELDEPDPIEALRAESTKEIADLKKQIEEDKANRERDGRLAQLQTLKDNGLVIIDHEVMVSTPVAIIRKDSVMRHHKFLMSLGRTT